MGSIGGTSFEDIGYVMSLDEPNEFGYRYWSDNHGTERTKANHLSILYTLTAVDGGTQLHLRHDDIRTDEYYFTMSTAWDALLPSLKQYVEGYAHVTCS